MKKSRLVVWLLVLGVAVTATSALAFNPATHTYIAERVYPNCADKINLRYGSIAPDLSMYAFSGKWPSGFYDTHYTYINLKPFAWGTAQKCFALGWWSHSEAYAADWFVHERYVEEKAKALAIHFGQKDNAQFIEFMHFAVETAIDVRLKQDNHGLADRLFEANVLRSPLDRELLTRVLVYKFHLTDWATLASAELAFRNLVGQYAAALVLPYPLDRLALAALGVQLAQQMYGINATQAYILAVLEEAIEECADYMTPINDAITYMPR